MSNFWYISDAKLWTGKLPRDILGQIITLLEKGMPVSLGDVVAECAADGIHRVLQPYLIIKSSNEMKVIDISQNVCYKTEEDINLVEGGRVLINKNSIININNPDEKMRVIHGFDSCNEDHYVLKIWGYKRPFASNKLYNDAGAANMMLYDITGNKLMRRVYDRVIFEKINIIKRMLADQLNINPEEKPKIIGRYFAFREYRPSRKYVLIPIGSPDYFIKCDSLCTFGKGLLYSENNEICYVETTTSYLVADNCPGKIVCAWDDKIVIYYQEDNRLVTRNLILTECYAGNKSY